jgi:hypothetical protein
MNLDAMKQVREALEWALDFIPPESETDCDCPLCTAYDAMSLAIEQAERVKRAEEAFAAASDEMKGEQAERQEPVAWMTELPPKEPNETAFRFTAHKFVADEWENSTPLYTAPPQRQPSSSFVAWNNTLCNPLAPAEKQNLSAWEDGYASGIKDQLQPLTEEEIDELARTMVKGERSVNWLARAIERAHGIGGEHE